MTSIEKRTEDSDSISIEKRRGDPDTIIGDSTENDIDTVLHSDNIAIESPRKGVFVSDSAGESAHVIDTTTPLSAGTIVSPTITLSPTRQSYPVCDDLCIKKVPIGRVLPSDCEVDGSAEEYLPVAADSGSNSRPEAPSVSDHGPRVASPTGLSAKPAVTNGEPPVGFRCSSGAVDPTPMGLLTASPERVSRVFSVQRLERPPGRPAPPQPVKRRLSLQDYRRRKQDPKAAPVQPVLDAAALWPHVPSTVVGEAPSDSVVGGMTPCFPSSRLPLSNSRSVTSTLAVSVSTASQHSSPELDLSPGSDTASPTRSPSCAASGSSPSSPRTLLSTVRWNDEPTALERQRETLTARLRRDFGIKVAEQGETEVSGSIRPPLLPREPPPRAPPDTSVPPPALLAAPTMVRPVPAPRASLLPTQPPLVQPPRLPASNLWRLRTRFPPGSLHALPNGLPTCPPPPPRPRPPLSQLRPLGKPSCPDN